MDDDIIEIKISDFAMVIKRRSLLYFLVVLIASIGTFFIFAYEMKDSISPELAIDLSSIGLQDFDTKEPDLTVKWEDFYNKFSHRSRNREYTYQEKFNKEFRYKIIKWGGTVLRVDSYDELDEFDDPDTQSLAK